MFKSKAQAAVLVGVVALWFAGDLAAKQVGLDVSLANHVLLANNKQTTFLKVGLTGFALPSAEERAPINIRQIGQHVR